MTDRSCLAIILAAGLGTRMRSTRPKVLHEIGGLPMAAHVIRAACAAGADRLALVSGPGMPELAALADAAGIPASVHIQQDRNGTAHAVLAARPAFTSGDAADDVLVLFGDTPLVTAETVGRVRTALAGGADLVVLGFEAENPTGYGRLLTQGDRLVAIREEKDATDEERGVTFCNSGIMGFRGAVLDELLAAIGNDNAQGEFYLTDAVEIANARGLKVVPVTGAAEEVQGVNNRVQLSDCEAVFQKRARNSAMLGGATLTAPETVIFSHDTVLGQDVLVEPNVVFGPGVSVADGATIRAFSHIEGAVVKTGAVVGPYARLRPGADIGENAKVGNFVEIKKATLGSGAKVNHLSYVGDASVGARANIGAGTITCNYDGYDKFRTEIGEGAFIGSNSALVAPASIGAGAIVAAGSVITDPVPADAFGVARGRQAVKEGWASDFRAKKGK